MMQLLQGALARTVTVVYIIVMYMYMIVQYHIPVNRSALA